MRRLLIYAAVVTMLDLLIFHRPAHCIYCPVYKCYGMCGSDCVCLTPPGSIHGGECWGIERVPALLAQGYRVTGD
jgi:hypothetical protein